MNTEPNALLIGLRLKRWSLALGVLALLGMVVVVLSVVAALTSDDFALAYPGDDGEFVLMTAEDFTDSQRLTIVTVLSATQWCWFWMMLQVWLISRCCSRGEILTPRSVTLLRRFAGGLFAMGVFEIIQYPIIDAYLQAQGNGAPIRDLWAACLGSGMLESFMAGVLVVIISTIFKLS
ncbi:MAG: DUF2975 domain-containing protein, partial [Planctomycetaceae bacterium]|nr:DUF2975 domain-containing protein [Planctomycetaceae bacterium]